MTPLGAAALLVWGTLVGLDLVSVGQVMISRPLVAASVAGAILGDPVGGVTVGLVLELFALEVLPVGASRYPDYGPASIAAAAVAAGPDPLRNLGIAVTAGLVVAFLSEFTILELRRRNTEAVHANLDRLSTGDPAVVRQFHRAGLARDALRSFILTACGLGVAVIARHWPPLTPRSAALLDVAAIGTGISAALSGALRAAGTYVGLRWFAIGIAAGIGVVALR